MTHTAIDPNDPNSAPPLSQEALEFGFSTFHPPQQRWFLRMFTEEIRLVDALLAGRDVATVPDFTDKEADDFRSLRETVLGFAGKETLPKLSDYDEETAKMLRADVSVGMHG